MHEVTNQVRDSTKEMNILIPEDFNNPFPDQTPRQLLERQYRVGTYSWQEGVPFLQTLNFPNALWNASIVNATRTFKWMRADVEIEIRVNTTPFQYGALMASWLPNHSNTSHCADLIQRSGNNPVVISASTQSSAKVVIPWLCPFAYFETFTNPVLMGSQIGRFSIEELVPLRSCSANSTAAAQVNVFARFLNVHTAAYVTSQSKVTRVPKSEIAQKSLLDIADGIAGSSVPSELFSAVTSIAKLVGFDYPPSLKPRSNFLLTPGIVAPCKGLDSATSLGVELDTRLPHPGYIIGNAEDTLSLASVYKTPMLHEIIDFIDATADSSIIVRPLLDNTHPDYLAWCANMFRYWRGSIKYSLQFYTSPMISARFRLTLLYFPPVAANDTLDSGDAPSKIIDVKGDTTINFTVPYSWITYYRQTSPADDTVLYPLLKIQTITPIQTPDDTITPHITCVVWRAGDDDTQFLQYRSPVKLASQASVQRMFVSDFESFLGGSKKLKEERFIDSEKIECLVDLFKRYQNQGALNTNPQLGSLLPEGLSYWSRIFKHWRGSRRFKCITLNNNVLYGVGVQRLAGATPARMSDGVQWTEGSSAPYLESIIPYYSTQPFVLTEANGAGAYSNATVSEINLFSASPATFYIAGGDDFTFGYLYAPPTWA